MHSMTQVTRFLARNKLFAACLFVFGALWFLFMSGILRTAVGPQADRGFWIFAAAYLMVAVVVACVILFVSGPRYQPLSPAMVWGGLGVSTAVAAAILVSIWNFDLDDKWVYYRVSENVLSSGLPLWNLNERALVGASFFYPYLLSIGHFFGGPQEWSNFEKILGIIFHFATVAIVLRYFGLTAIGLISSATILLFEPSLQWALGGLETSLTTLWIVVAIILYMRRGGESWLFWFMCGLLIYIRPDAILLGIGTFVGSFLREPTKLRRHIVAGAIFSAPILVYMASNQLLFGFPLPLVFLIKGWNCAYCGSYPLYSRAAMGMIHMLSAISVSVLLGLLLFLAVSFLVRETRVSRSITQPVVTAFPQQFDLLLGFAAYLGYHVAGGYQHMNFTFRYWIPGLLGAAVVSGEIIRQALSKLATRPDSDILPMVSARFLTAPVVAGLLTVQLVQSAFATYEGKYIDITLTVAPLRDQFSVDGYASYLASWHQAGRDLSPVVTKDDRVFLMQAMTAGALTAGYLVDQFYFPPKESKYLDLKECRPQLPDQFNCAILYDYYVTFVDNKFWPPSHDLWKKYETLAIVRRKNFSIPDTPGDLSGTRIAADTVDIKWKPVIGEFYSEIETKDRTGQKFTKAPPGYRVFRLEKVSGDVSVRMRACNDKGCSNWSEPVVVG